ncbi:hypothetical protein [Streptomyces sp. NPDC058548]|uniref:hypothetical protein n=1 Tax=Streptomyces sp. NPDC058548 TaxID=3346545 RepID=UPI003664918D
MPNCTDLNALDVEAVAPLVLSAVAEHFTVTNPTDVLESANLLICVGAEAFRLVDRRPGGEAQALAKHVMTLMPELHEGITRGEYALHVRALLPSAGHDWPDGPNDPAIPRITGIPAPRKDPKPSVPTQPSGPKAVTV